MQRGPDGPGRDVNADVCDWKMIAGIDRWEIGSGSIITYTQEGEIQVPGSRTVHLIPAWKWLIEDTHSP